MVKERILEAQKDILENKVSAYIAAQKLIDNYFNDIKNKD